MAQPGMVGETGQGFGWLRLEAWGSKLMMETRMAWPPLEVPRRAPLDVLGKGFGPECWKAGSGGTMIQRARVD